MSLKSKIIIVIVPVIFVSLFFVAFTSLISARLGITKIAGEFLGYKVNEIHQKAENQYMILKEHNSLDDAVLVQAAKKSVFSYASSILEANEKAYTSVIAVNSQGIILNSTDPTIRSGSKITFLKKLKNKNQGEWIEFNYLDYRRVGFYKFFEKWDWFIIINVFKSIFYQDADRIITQSTIIGLASLLLTILILLFFINFLLKPLTKVVNTMTDIINYNDMSKKVKVEYDDEIGNLANTFNIMLTELVNANNQIKESAFQAVLSQKKEERIKTMFQKYVPQDVVNEIVSNPDSALVGKDQNVTILFSDIRDFTTISESMKPDVLVRSLNEYFTIMVDIIYKRKGVIDKYIGDAIMAVFGAPKTYGDDVIQAVLAGIQMLENLGEFNSKQIKNGYHEFRIGIGINYGPVTVGNIGTQQKMDYTVIGDAVNLASRLEGLTKEYKTNLIISENTYKIVKNHFYVKKLGLVEVKGKTKPVAIYEPARKLTNKQKNYWRLHNIGMDFYLNRQWDKAIKNFSKILSSNSKDYLAQYYINICNEYTSNPPPEEWNGVKKMTTK